MLLPAVLLLSFAAGAVPCAEGEAVTVVEGGRATRSACADEARAAGLTVLDLGDAWTPALLEDTPYAPTWVGLAGEVPTVEGAGPRAVDDRFFELWGIPPSLGTVALRLEDAERHRCHGLVKNEALARLTGVLRARPTRPGKKGSDDATNALQGHLVCDGFLRVDDADGDFGPATARALAVWQRREGLPGDPGLLDDEGRERLLLNSRTRDVMALLRALRERVADAAGLIEDGTARGAQTPVMELLLDPPSLRPARRPPAPLGAPDLIDDAADAAARALGLEDAPELAATVRRWASLRRVAVRLPPPPPWHAAHMDLFATIDRGDVSRAGLPVPGGSRPVLQLFARVDGEDVPLVAWPTTIGGEQREKLGSGVVVKKDKASPTGHFVWRWLWAAPAWYAPPTTPDDELTLRTSDGVVINDEGIGPGYRSAYGLVMLQHHDVVPGRDGVLRFGDTGVRTHGTGNVRSVLEGGVSHGCHRLLPRHALRLGGFLLQHRSHGVPERVNEGWHRDVKVGDKHMSVERSVRGTRTELMPPVDIEVLEECPGEG